MNILILTADQLRWDALACNQASATDASLAHVIETPNLDRLAEMGATFHSCFSPNPLCAPARASITTGRYPHRCAGSKRNSNHITENQPKLAEIFSGAGFSSYAVGKLHYMPYGEPGEPRLVHGFQHVELHEEGRILAKYDPDGRQEGLEDYHDYLKDKGWGGYERGHGIGNNDVKPATTPLPVHCHEEAWVAERTIALLRRHMENQPDTPFLFWASFSKPHAPYDPPAPYNTMYDPRGIPGPIGKWDDEDILNGRDRELASRRRAFGWDTLSPESVQTIRAYYAGLVTFQDRMIGEILDSLEEEGVLDTTIIVFTSDHGDLLGDFGSFFKKNMFDGSVRIPMLWSVPGMMKGGDPHGRYQMVGLQDILPTLCGLTGVELPGEVDGEDLSPLFVDPDYEGRDYIVSQCMEPPEQKYMLRTHEWKYVYTEVGGIEELYDVPGDRQEMRNLAGDERYDSTKALLREKLLQWLDENHDAKMVVNGDLASSPVADHSPAEFEAKYMGWRKY